MGQVILVSFLPEVLVGEVYLLVRGIVSWGDVVERVKQGVVREIEGKKRLAKVKALK